MMKLVLTIIIAIIVFCGYMIFDLSRLQAARRKSLRNRISENGLSAEEEEQNSLMALSGEPSPQAALFAGIMRGIGIPVDDLIRKLEVRFVRAGIDSPDTPVYYLFFQRVVSLPLGVLAFLLFTGAEGDQKLLMQAIAVFTAIIAAFGARLYLQNMIDKRAKLLQRAFPDTLDLLLICVESGLALDAALNRVCRELTRAYPEMTAELNRTRLELALLNDRVRALMNLGDRTGMVAFRSLVVALVQSERFGTSLSDTLRVLSEDFRLQRLANAEAKASRLPVLMTIPLICFLMPSFMLIILGPAIISFMRHGQLVTGAK